MSPPIPLSLMICDDVWRDPNSGKHHLLGTFSAISSGVFPLVTNLAVYFAITEGQGPLQIRMELVDKREGATQTGQHPCRSITLRLLNRHHRFRILTSIRA